jgi:lipoprotein-releasing system permease protein
MKHSLTITIAFSLLIARWRQTMVAAVGVTFSIAMFIALLAFMVGFNTLLDGLVINRTPHVRLYNDVALNRNQPIRIAAPYRDYYHFISSVKADRRREEIYNSALIIKAVHDDNRTLGVSPKIITPAFFKEGSVSIPGIIQGIDVLAENNLFHFNEYITGGSSTALRTTSNSIIVGKALAEKLQAAIGDHVYVTSSAGETLPLELVAYFQSGFADFDKTVGYVSLSTAQKLLGKPASFITEIHIKLKSIEEAPETAKEFGKLFATQSEDIQKANADFDTGSFVRSLISYVVGITLLIVAGFGIYNILNMMIYEKMDSIAILKATGFSSADVKRIFLLISLSIGFFGGMLGLFFGYILSRIIDAIPFITPSFPTIKTYPVDYSPFFYITSMLFSLLSTFLAGWSPAVKAAHIDPVVIIRGK